MSGLAGTRAGTAAEHTEPPVAHTRGGTGAESVVLVVAVLVLAAEASALLLPKGWMWGADAYVFLPRTALWWGVGAAAALAVLAFRRGRKTVDGAATPAGSAAHPALVVGLVAIAMGLLFWVFRIRHVLLGDGIPITSLLPGSHEIHPREPLASLYLQICYRVLSPVFARPGVPQALVVQSSVAVGSVLAGLLFVAVARFLAVEIVRSFPAREPEREARLTWALTFGLLAQGYVQMFFGYVELYALPVVVAALFMALALRFLRGAGSILAPLAAAALGVALDFTGVALGPAVLVLVGAGLLDRARHRTVVRDLLVTLGLTIVAVGIVTGLLRYPIVSHVAGMLASGRAGADYLYSAAHLRDFANEHLLLGPFGLFLFAPLAASLLWTGVRPRDAVVFLLVAGVSVAGACWSAPDLPMGYARDWDLFSPLGVVLTAAAIGLAMALVRDPLGRRRVAVAIAAVSLVHTVPWIALNTSEVRSVERFKALPLGGGRAENTVAFWYAQRGDLRQAKQWLRKSLAVDPANNRALDLLGRIAFEERDARTALQAYVVAVALRPDKPDYRLQLAYAVDAVGGPAVALRQLDSLMVGHEDSGSLWLERSMLLHADGQAAKSKEARQRALELSPDLASVADGLPPIPDR